MRILLMLMPFLPLILFLVDGLDEKNLNKGVIHIVACVLSCIICLFLTRVLGIWFVLLIPVYLAVFLIAAKRKTK